jgi:hypothetical protein
MPTADQHRAKIAHNRLFLNSVSVEDFPDWVATAAFYTALHLVEQLRVASGHGQSENHTLRAAYVRDRHPTIFVAYRKLQNASNLARYHARADFFRQFQPADIAVKLVAGCLDAIEQYVGDRLGL